MDQNYQLNALDFSLANVCCVKVVCQLAELVQRREYASFRSLYDMRVTHKGLNKTAAGMKEIVEKLELPPKVKVLLQSLVMPIAKEIVGLYGVCSYVKPIWTVHGSVDLVRSIKDCLKNKNALSHTQCFELACMICDEESIFKITTQTDTTTSIWGQLMADWVGYTILEPRPLFDFWFTVYHRLSDSLIDGRCLPKRAYVEGFNAVMENSNVYGRNCASNYFIDQLSQEEMERCHTYFLSVWPVCYEEEITPITLCKFFSKLSADRKHEVTSFFTEMLLITLLNWPYQRFFTKAACALVKHLSLDTYWSILQKPLTCLANGFTDCDYGMLFKEFWELGCKQWPSTPISLHWWITTSFNVLASKDAHIIEFFLSNLSSNEQRIVFLLGFNPGNICHRVLYKSDFQKLEMLIRRCDAYIERQMEKCENQLEKYKNAIIVMRNSINWVPNGNSSKYIDAVGRLAEIVDGIWAEKHPVNNTSIFIISVGFQKNF